MADYDIDALDSVIAPETPDKPETRETPEKPSSLADTVRQAYDDAREKAGAEPDTEQPGVDRSRDQRGRFAGKAQGDEARTNAQAAPADQQEAPKPAEQAQEQPLVVKPPVGWSAAARAQFTALPPEVQEAVSRREQEVNNGFKVLQEQKQQLESYRELEQFTPIVKANGMTHAQVMQRALDWEQATFSDPVGSIVQLANLRGVDLVRMAQMLQQRGYRAPQPQQQGSPMQRGPAPAQQQIQPQPQNIEAIVDQKVREREASQSAERFLSDPKNVHAEAVADDMAALIRAGRAQTLEAAYDMACWARPDIRALLIKQQGSGPSNGRTPQQRAADQARNAAKATTGAPSSRPAAAKPQSYPTVRSALTAAYEAALDRE